MEQSALEAGGAHGYQHAERCPGAPVARVSDVGTPVGPLYTRGIYRPGNRTADAGRLLTLAWHPAREGAVSGPRDRRSCFVCQQC